jgi:D-alanine-D-alanine ligase
MELKGRAHRPAPWTRLGKVSRVIVAHNPVGPADDPSTSDVLAQVELVTGALGGLGVAVTRLGVADWRIWEDLQRLATHGPGGPGTLGTAGPAALAPGTVVFNLVEAPPGMPGVHPATAAALELLGIPFSGSSAAALWLSTDKLATRALLAAEGVPVPPGGRLDHLGDPCGHGRGGVEVFDRVPPPWILKPAYEDASLGLDGAAVCATRAAALARAAELLRRFPGQPLVVERYLPGRELNVSLLAAPQGAPRHPPMVLPVAEIEFVDYPPGMPRIVGYEAKWQPESFAYTHTVRRFPREAAAAPLLAEARRLALAAWRACGLSGYGRVDLRLDERGVPHVLEVNANPCLAADAGFMAAAEQAGLTAAEVISRILTDAVARHRVDRHARIDRIDRIDRPDRRQAAPPSAHRAALVPLPESGETGQAAEAAAGPRGSRTARPSSRRLRAVS